MRRPFLTLALLLALASACDSLTGSSNITYRISSVSATRVSITYESGSGVSQVSNAAVPWSYSFKAERDDFLYVSAQIVEGAGPITVTIRKDEQTWKTATAAGFAAIATASGTLD